MDMKLENINTDTGYFIADIEVVVEKENNNKEYLNKIVKEITNAGYTLINDEVSWRKNLAGENVVCVRAKYMEIFYKDL